MSVKVKILSENKKQKIDESMMSLLSDPMMLAAGGAGLIALYQAVFGKKPDPEETLERVKERINQRHKQAMADMEAGNKEREMLQRMKDARIKRQLDDLKRQKEMELPPPEDVPDAALVKVPEPKDIKKYIDVKALAMRAATEGEKEAAERKMRKLEEEFPGIQDHPEVQSAKKLNELFRRFI
jgi:hypothetical protein